MRFVTQTVHAWLDYPVALALIALPFVLGLGNSHPLALVISPMVGLAAFLLTLFTDHQFGLFRLLPYRLHLAVDFAVGLLFLALPIFLGFAGMDAAIYVVNSIAVVLVIALSSPEDSLLSA